MKQRNKKTGDEEMIDINDLPAFPPVTLTKEQAVKLAQMVKEAKDKYQLNKEEK